VVVSPRPVLLRFYRLHSKLNRLIIFLKAPRAGTVKTRLAESIGAFAAVAAYRQLVETLLASLQVLDEVELRYSPDDAQAEIQPWLRPHWQARPQGEGDLGQRLQAAFAEAFASGANRVVVIGSDCPSVTPGDIHAAWEALVAHDLALGPARDGGYWLIGLRAPQSTLFQGIAWSTDSVFPETLQRAEAADLRVHLLRELADVDTVKEWREFLKLT
jgi:rSAM/selenodomain-associated transferase 1